MSIIEKRYKVGEDFKGEFYIDEQEGQRTVKIVRLKFCDLLWGCGSTMKVKEWDRLPKTPQEAKETYIKEKIKDVENYNWRIMQCFDSVSKASKLEPVARKRKERC